MNHKFVSILQSYYPLFLLFLLDIALLPIIYLFWSTNNLLNWDFPGHIAQINFYKENLLPFLSGWNNEYSLGYPQGDFYPPIFHYLIALLCLFYNDPFFWIKILFSITLISLPLVIYYFLKSFFINIIRSDPRREDIVIATAVTIFVIVLGPILYGGTLKSFAILGLLNNFLALPFFFVFLGSILYFPSKLNWNYILRNVLLLSLIMLSHMVVGFVSVIITMFVYICASVQYKNVSITEIIKSLVYNNLFISLVLTFFVTIFFYIPFIAYQDFVTSQIMTPPDRLTTFGLALFSITLAIIYKQGSKLLNKRLFLGIYIPLLIFVIYCVIEVVLLNFGHRLLTGIVQSYRLLAFSMLVFPGITALFLIGPIRDFIFPKIVFFKKYFHYSLMLLPLALLIISFLQTPNLKSYISIDFEEREIAKRQDGNYLSLSFDDSPKTFIRTDVYSNIVTKQNVKFVNVLFAESSYHETLVTSLKSSIDTADFSYSKPSRKLYPDTYKMSFDEVRNTLSLLNVKYLLYTDNTKLKYDLCGKDRFLYATIKLSEGVNRDLSIYGCRLKNEIYVKNFDISQSTKNWDETNYDAIFDERSTVFTNNKVEGGAYVYNGNIDWWRDGQRFSIYKTKKDFAILPVQYNPRWQAYKNDCCGNIQEVKISRVTPNLIGVEDKGQIYFEYELPLWEKTIGFISLTTFIAVIAGYIWTLIRKK